MRLFAFITQFVALLLALRAASASPFSTLVVRYTRDAEPGGQILLEWSSWAFVPREYVVAGVVANSELLASAEDELTDTSNLHIVPIGPWRLTRNDGRFELPLPFSMPRSQKYRAVLGEAVSPDNLAPRAVLVSRAFRVGDLPLWDSDSRPSNFDRPLEDTFEHEGVRGAAPSPDSEKLRIVEPSSSLYIAAEPVPLRWRMSDGSTAASSGAALIKVLRQGPRGEWREEAFFRVPNSGAVDLEMTPTACRGSFIIELRLEEFAAWSVVRSGEFSFDTDRSGDDFHSSGACVIQPRTRPIASGDSNRDSEGWRSEIQKLAQWWTTTRNKIREWRPSSLEVLYLAGGAVAALAVLAALLCCCCPKSCCCCLPWNKRVQARRPVFLLDSPLSQPSRNSRTPPNTHRPAAYITDASRRNNTATAIPNAPPPSRSVSEAPDDSDNHPVRYPSLPPQHSGTVHGAFEYRRRHSDSSSTRYTAGAGDRPPTARSIGIDDRMGRVSQQPTAPPLAAFSRRSFIFDNAMSEGGHDDATTVYV